MAGQSLPVRPCHSTVDAGPRAAVQWVTQGHRRVELGFAITCPLAGTVGLKSSSCPSARVFVPRFVQTSPRDDALALH